MASPRSLTKPSGTSSSARTGAASSGSPALAPTHQMAPGLRPGCADADLRDALPAIYRAVRQRTWASPSAAAPQLPRLCAHPAKDGAQLRPRSGRTATRAGLLVRPPTCHLDRGLRERSVRGGRALGRRAVPVRSRLRLLVARTRIGSDERATTPLSHVDWSQTQAFGLPSDMTSYVRINLAGREPEGIVRPSQVRPSLRRSVRGSRVGDGCRYGDYPLWNASSAATSSSAARSGAFFPMSASSGWTSPYGPLPTARARGLVVVLDN